MKTVQFTFDERQIRDTTKKVVTTTIDVSITTISILGAIGKGIFQGISETIKERRDNQYKALQ